jgi:hypothetical protein
MGCVHPAALADLAAPALPGARCRGQWKVFDAAAGDRRYPHVAQACQQALAICRCCPCLIACRRWVDGLPPGVRPSGVVAGMVTGRASGPVTGHHSRHRANRAKIKPPGGVH